MGIGVVAVVTAVVLPRLIKLWRAVGLFVLLKVVPWDTPVPIGSTES